MDEKGKWKELLQHMIAVEASDLHAAPGQCVRIRRDGALVSDTFVPSASFMDALLGEMISEGRRAILPGHDVDFSWTYAGRRFRGNAYHMENGIGLALRLLPARIMTPDEIGMPDALRSIAAVRDGLVLVCGPTGAGKTTTLASLIEVINQTRRVHIITLEDPIEYIFLPASAFISQRELGRDFSSFPDAVRSALREDPDILLAVCAPLAGLESTPPYCCETVAEQNWVQITQAQFEPTRISERLWIVPSWHEPPDPEAIALILDPGMAFGTGSHPTTRLCLEWLEHTVSPCVSVLDYGCGSGILAIAAARFGAAEVLGVDIDAQAVAVARSNAERNGVRAHFADSANTLQGQFDIVVANILSNPLKALAPALCAHVRPGGRLALSGILAEQTDELIAAYAPWLPLTVAAECEGWVCLSGIKDCA